MSDRRRAARASSGGRGGWASRLASSRRSLGFAVVLLLVGASATFQLAVPEEGWTRVVTAVLQSATLLASLSVVGFPRPLVVAAGAVSIGAVAGTVAGSIAGSEFGVALTRMLNGLLVVLAPPALLVGVAREIREVGRVPLGAVTGVLSVYLLIGMAFGFLYGSIDELSDRSVLTAAPSITGTSDFLYFSYVTLTTTGYGDLVPAVDSVRSAAVAEALIGQIYLVTVVALLVANLRPRAGRRAPER